MRIAKSIQNGILGIMILTGTSACVEFSFPPCDYGRLTDVPALSEGRSFKFTDSGTHKVASYQQKFDRLGKGLYSEYHDGNVNLRTCQIGRSLYAEHVVDSKSTEKTFELSRIELLGQDFLLSSVAVDIDDLKRLGVSYHTERRSIGSRYPFVLEAQGFRSENDSPEIVVIDQINASHFNALSGVFQIESLLARFQK